MRSRVSTVQNTRGFAYFLTATLVFSLFGVGLVTSADERQPVVSKLINMENDSDRCQPLPAKGPIRLQHHGDPLEFHNIFIKEH